MKNDWMLGKINLTDTARLAEWHLGTTINSLKLAGLDYRSAEASAAFIFAESATSRGGRADCEASEYLTSDQWDALELA